MHFADRISRIKPSPTLAAAARARALATQGVSVINFGQGEPDFDTPEPIKTACATALHNGKTKYGPVPGIPELRAAISAKLKRENGLDYPAAQIIVTVGSKSAIFGCLQVCIGPGDAVIIPAPYWVSYADQVALCDGTPIIVPTPESNGFKLTPEMLERVITPQCKLLIINSPCNPTGTVYTRTELAALGAVCARHQMWVLSDEIYEHLTYPPAQFASFAAAAPQHRGRTILVNGVSKAYAMTGWRIGFAAGPTEIMQALDTWQSQVTTHATTFAQWGAVAAYTNAGDAVATMRTAFAERRAQILQALRVIPGIRCAEPDGAFYAFPNVQAYLTKRWQGRAITTTVDLADYCLDQAHIAVVPGEAFGAPGYFRFSYALGTAEIQEGMQRFATALHQLET